MSQNRSTIHEHRRPESGDPTLPNRTPLQSLVELGSRLFKNSAVVVAQTKEGASAARTSMGKAAKLLLLGPRY